MSSTSQNYVLVVDNNGDMDILNLAYETHWKDLCVLLKVKFEYDETPTFTYTDDEEEYICLDNQDALEEAFKIAKQNSDVLHVQIRPFGTPNPLPTRRRSRDVPSRDSSLYTANVERARAVVENTFDWVRTTFRRNSSIDPAPASTHRQDDEPNMFSNDVSTEMKELFRSAGESHANSLLHSNNASSAGQTTVKEIGESQSCDNISVPTESFRFADEVTVKQPVEPEAQQLNQRQDRQMDGDMIEKIKEEVRLAISKELLSFRDQISAGLLHNRAEMSDDNAEPSTSRDADPERPRSPSLIKADIRKLKQEMKEAKQVKKAKRQNEKALAKEKTLLQGKPSSEPHRKARKYVASFICENLLDGTCVGIGQKFVKYWVLKNEGTTTWDYQIELKLIDQSAIDDSSPVDPSLTGSDVANHSEEAEGRWGPEKLSVVMPTVESGNTAVIAVSHVAPNFACAYTSAWRLCRGDKFFGPRIWCSVSVVSTSDICSRSSDEAFSIVSEQDSFVSKSWVPSRKESTNDNAVDAGDDLSNMLSFEMTAVGDYNKDTSIDNEHRNNYNFKVSYPPTQPPSESQLQTEAKEESEKHDSEPASLLEPEEPQQAPASLKSVDHHVDVEEEEDEQDEEEQEERDEEEKDCQDFEEQDEFDDVVLNDSNSDVPSDFEVIPIPECFDTTKPLTDKTQEGAVQAKEEDEKDADSSSGEEQDEDAEEMIVDDEDPSPAKLETSLPSNTVAASLPIKPTDRTPLSPRPLSLNPSPQIIPDPSLTEQARSSADEQSNLLETSSATRQATMVPVPLPRVVQDAHTSGKAPLETAPSPHPRVSASSAPSSSSPQVDEHSNKRDSAGSTPHTSLSPIPNSALADSPSVEVSEDAEEYTLASEVFSPVEPAVDPPIPAQSPQLPVLPILSGTGYRTSVPPISAPQRGSNPTSSDGVVSPGGGSDLPAAETGSDLPSEEGRRPEQPEPTAPAQDPSPLEQLVDMGFYDIELNEDLLKEFEGDVNRAVHALVSRGSVSSRRGRRGDGSYVA